MNTLLATEEFENWLQNLKDQIGKARILATFRSAEAGSFGDSQSVGDGVSEVRIHFGPGYRVYFCRREKVTYLLLCGGDKASQKKDIRESKRILKEIES